MTDENAPSQQDVEALRIFREVLEAQATQRTDLVSRACAGDDALRSRVERLLKADGSVRNLEQIFGKEMARASEDLDADLIGRRVGRYRIIRRIGSGGMGTVYEAEQDEPKRRVALKTLKLGVDSKDAQSRFKLEVQVLARMAHPGVAAILEASTHAGVQFFAMEFVEGARAVTDYVEEEKLGDEQRIDLFLEFCDAVAYGHARGVVHRDLKPANLLVDQTGRPKIIDFGVARALEPVPDVTFLPTSSGEIVGTIGYMSPEQLSGDPDQVDVQSDVYALGFVLFQILCGKPPKDATGMALTEAIRTLASAEPLRLKSVRSDLPVELDWITRKALESDRNHRYRTVNELADDLRRLRAHEPVLAGPPSAVYRVRKFVRRHRLFVTAATLLLVSLLAGVIGTWRALMRESAQRERLEKMTGFQKSIFSSLVAQQLGPDARMVDVLEAAARRVPEVFADDPISRAELQGAFSASLYALGRFGEAARLSEGAVATLTEELGERAPETLRSRASLASNLHAMEDLDAAIAVFEPLVEDMRQVLGPHDSQALRTSVLFALALLEKNELERAEVLLDRAAADYDEAVSRGLAFGNTAQMLHDVRARVLTSRGREDDALAVYEKAEAEFTDPSRERHPDMANMRFNRAMLLKKLDRFEEARPLFRDALRVMRPHLGPDHPMVEMISVHFCETIRRSGTDVEEAFPLYDEVIRIKRLRPGDPITLYRQMQNRSAVHWMAGNQEQAIEYVRELIALMEREDPDVWFLAFSHNALGDYLRQSERFDEAEQQLKLALSLARRFADHPEIDPANPVRLLIELYETIGREEEAERLRQELYG